MIIHIKVSFNQNISLNFMWKTVPMLDFNISLVFTLCLHQILWSHKSHIYRTPIWSQGKILQLNGLAQSALNFWVQILTGNYWAPMIFQPKTETNLWNKSLLIHKHLFWIHTFIVIHSWFIFFTLNLTINQFILYNPILNHFKW